LDFYKEPLTQIREDYLRDYPPFPKK
jgi:hypothetical protein